MSRQLAAARKLLSDAQLIAFLYAVQAEGHVRAANIILPGKYRKVLDLDESFGNLEPPPRRELGLTAELKVVRLSARTFRITFGMHGAGVGDGGVWRVVFTAGGAVQRIQQEGFWIH